MRAPPMSLTADAVARAAESRRALHRADPRFAAHTAAAFAERVVGLPARSERAGAGWWRVGRVVDGIAGAEVAVQLHPAAGRVRVARPGATREPSFPTPPPPGGRWFDGARLRWVEPGDGDDR